MDYSFNDNLTIFKYIIKMLNVKIASSGNNQLQFHLRSSEFISDITTLTYCAFSYYAHGNDHL